MTVHHFTFQRIVHGDDVVEIGKVLDRLTQEGREVVSASHSVYTITTFNQTYTYVDVVVVTREAETTYESRTTYERDLISRMEDWLGVHEGYIDEHEDEYRALQREVRVYLRGNQ
jgi:hypothetical protein